MTLSWTLQVETTTLKDGTYPHVFLPDPFNNISKNSKQQINSKNVFLFIFIIFYIFSQVSHVSADWFHNHNGKQKCDLSKSNQLFTLFFGGRALFSFLVPKGFKIDNDFECLNFLSAMKMFLSNINSFWYSYVNRWVEIVIKDCLQD